jgi:hypothetical protein
VSVVLNAAFRGVFESPAVEKQPYYRLSSLHSKCILGRCRPDSALVQNISDSIFLCASEAAWSCVSFQEAKTGKVFTPRAIAPRLRPIAAITYVITT